MKNKGQVQTNMFDVNILVDTENSNNTHFYGLNKDVEIIKVLSDKDVIIEFKKIFKDLSDNELLEFAKDVLKKKEGYATSNCEDKILGIKQYSSIIKYLEL